MRKHLRWCPKLIIMLLPSYIIKCVLCFQRVLNARVLLMGSYRSTHRSAKRFTAIFNSYTPWLGGIIFIGSLWSPYLSLFLSYIWSREKCFNSKTPLGKTVFGYGNLIAGLIKGKVGWALDISTSRIVLNPKAKPSAMHIGGV